MTLYTFARWDFPASLFGEFAATVELIKSDRYARRAAKACHVQTYGAWLSATRTDGRTRRIGTKGFAYCLREARRELGY